MKFFKILLRQCCFSISLSCGTENYTEVLDLDKDKCDILPPKIYHLDGWVRESLPELLNSVLSLPPGSERDEAKRVLKQKMDSLIDKNLKRTLYSVCRSLKILN